MSGRDGDRPCPVTLAAAIIEAYVRTNPVPPEKLPPLLAAIGETLRALCDGPPRNVPAFPTQMMIAKTITPDYIISLEDGRPYRSLKRHLASRGLTPEQYRAKWGLNADYPMVAPSFSAQRADQARARERAKRKRTPAPSKVKAPARQHTPLPA